MKRAGIQGRRWQEKAGFRMVYDYVASRNKSYSGDVGQASKILI